MTLESLAQNFFLLYYFFPTHPKAEELAIKRQPLIHPSSGSENTTCGNVAEMDGGAGLAVYRAREEPSIFKRLIWWLEQKIRQVSPLIRNRKPQSLQLWYTSHFPPALGFVSAVVTASFPFILYLFMRSWSKGFLVPAQQGSQQ